jgi:hypothetical protein
LRYLKIQAAVFVCGIVGPIFLAIYFGSQPNTSMRWAYWAGLFITAADVLIALAITSASDPAKKPAAKRRQSGGGSHTSDSSSSSYDPYSATAFTFSTDSGSSSSDSGWFSSDSGSSDSGSSSSSG